MEGLEWVFIMSVINTQALTYIQDDLYGGNWEWEPDSGLRNWYFGTPQYDALKGTRIGKMVSNLVLGGFSRSTRRVRQIITWPIEIVVNMRLDMYRGHCPV